MRHGVSFEQVAAAAEAIRGRGERPTLRSVRGELGTGSLTTIQVHLSRWQQTQPAEVATTAEALPPDIARVILSEITRRENAVRKEAEAHVLELRDTVGQLTTEGQSLQADSEKKDAALTALATERDTVVGRLRETQDALAALRAELTREREAAESARIEAAKAQVRAEEAGKLVAELKARISELTAK